MRVGVCDVSKLIGRNRYAKEKEIETIKINLKCQMRGVKNYKEVRYKDNDRPLWQIDNCKRGIRMEKETLIKLRNEDRRIENYNKYLRLNYEDMIDIYGKLDGVEYDDDGKVKKVIEIKNRRNYTYMAPYEYDQIYLYIYMINIEHGREDITGEFVQQLEEVLYKQEFTYEQARDHCETILLPLLKKTLETI